MSGERFVRDLQDSIRSGAGENRRLAMDGTILPATQRKARSFFYDFRHGGRLRGLAKRIRQGGPDDYYRSHRLGRYGRTVAHTAARDQTATGISLWNRCVLACLATNTTEHVFWSTAPSRRKASI